MVKAKFFLLIVLLSGNIAFGQCGGTLIWSDEFNGTSLNTANWNYDLGDGCPSLCGWGNNELEYYTNSTNNVRVGGGILTIEARAENMGGRNFTSGKIHTNGKFSQAYGRFEARMRLPAGNGLWPAFWMLPTTNNWPTTGEIDIMEFRGDILNRVAGTLHYGNTWPNNQWDGTDYDHTVNDLHTTYHTYAVEWQPGEIRWYFDNIRFKTETQTPNSLNPASNNANQWPWTTNFYIILNNAVGGWFPGVTDPAQVVINKGTFEIDYVRVYDMSSSAGFQTPYFGTPIDLPATIQAENFDRGCGDAAYSDAEMPNQGGQYRQEKVDIEATTDAGGGYNVGWINTNEWLEYTVNVPGGGLYNFSFRVAAQTAGGRIRLEVDGVSAGTVNVPATGGWQSWQNLALNSVTLSPGNHVLRVFFEAGNFNFNYFGTTLVTLPSTWIFASFKNDNLIWQTNDFSPNDFQIQRNEFGFWKTIKTVQSNRTNEYVINFPKMNEGEYRIIQELSNGEMLVSDILYFQKSSILVYPNPFADKLTIELKDHNERPVLSDLRGNSLYFSQLGDEWVLNTEVLPSGIYFVDIGGEVVKVVK